MVMPCYKVLYPSGCVGSVRTTARQSHLTMYIDPAEIRRLHRYFAGPSSIRPGKTIADEIVEEGADFGASRVRPIGPCAIVRPRTESARVRVFRIRKAAKGPTEVKKFPHHMEDGWFYWGRKIK